MFPLAAGCFEMNENTRAGHDWNTVRVVVFWFGAAYTAILGLTLLIAYWVVSSNPMDWYGVNIFAGPSIAYSVALLELRLRDVRILAIFLFLVALLFSLSPGIMLFNLPGLICLSLGTPVRSHSQPIFQPLD